MEFWNGGFNAQSCSQKADLNRVSIRIAAGYKTLKVGGIAREARYSIGEFLLGHFYVWPCSNELFANGYHSSCQ